MTQEMTKAQSLKKLIESDEILILPGCHDVLTAKIAEEEGIKAPVLINQVEGGKTPLLRAEELQKLGAAVAQYCTPSFFVLAKALKDFYRVLKQKGTSREDLSMMETFPPFNSRLGMSKFIELDDKYLSIEKQFEDKGKKE